MKAREKKKAAGPRRTVRKPRPRKAGYHHGDLRQALIEASESILLERGVEGFTLREAARRAGVSPAAPAHHFGDVTGLLTAVAREGFLEFGRMLAEADMKAGPDAFARLKAQGDAYVRFAFSFPARFLLMFRRDLVDPKCGDFGVVAGASFATLESAVRALAKIGPDEAMPQKGWGALLAVWSMVHGFAHLALEKQFEGAPQDLGGPKRLLDEMLPAMLEYMPDKLK